MIEMPIADQYQLQAEAFGKAIRAGKPLRFDQRDAVETMRIIDAFFTSEKSAKWERVKR